VVRLKISETGEIINLSAEDYIFGVVAAEMPALYETEALKAQAVAAYTYYLAQKEEDNKKEYDITDDYTVDQAFITAENARKRWGDGADEYENKIRSAVKAVMYERVTYNGQLASTLYHAISFGVTENAEDVWGGQYPYLVSVDSSFDKLSQDYISSAVFTGEQFKEKISSLAEVKSIEENCITDIIRTQAGGVTSLNVSGKKISGSDIRKALDLRSANFTVNFSEGKYTFTVYGYGHSIGMSQYGAEAMAQKGSDYQEILAHYYPGTTVESRRE
jgi:stage II sporulation protein D